jgi:8-oxo-dGTP pyrophosphatase MutT (NUDIX family)
MSESSSQNPFKILSTRAIYDNSWIRVREHQILNPQGRPGIYGLVEFKNRAVGVIPYEDGYVWLVGQYRLPLKKYSWEIPKGGSPQSEALLETARRELKEETGLEAEQWEPLVELHLSNSVCDEYGIVYLAMGLRRGEASPEETELLSLARVPLEEVYSRINAGEITDSLTVAGIFRLMLKKAAGELD